MNSKTIAAPRRAGVDWLRAEFVLTLLGFVGFLTLPIRITTIYGGLPAHPLFVHVPVVLIPVTIITAIVLMVRTEWLERYGMPTGLALVDRPLASPSMFAALRVVLVLLALGAGYMTFRTGDLGAKAVWQGRLQVAQHAFPGGEIKPGEPPPGAGGP